MILLVSLRLASFFGLHFDLLARHPLHVISITLNVPTRQQLRKSAWARLGSFQGLGFKVNSQHLIELYAWEPQTQNSSRNHYALLLYSQSGTA